MVIKKEMKLTGIRNTGGGKYLKSYALDYENDEGKKKTYEIVSHNVLERPEDIGEGISGASICAIRDDKILLLKEYRMGVNRFVYNFCAGMQEEGESVEECVARELYEETGLTLKKINKILPPCFAAVAISDIRNQLVFAEVEGEPKDHATEIENIKAGFYTREEVKELLMHEDFAARAQVISYLFSEGKI